MLLDAPCNTVTLRSPPHETASGDFMANDTLISVRLSAELLKEIGEAQRILAEDTDVFRATTVTRTLTIREALHRGLAVIRSEYMKVENAVDRQRGRTEEMEIGPTKPNKAKGGPRPTVASNKLLSWRKKKRFSQERAAEKLGRGQSQWSRWERGHLPREEFRGKLEEMTDIAPGDWKTPASEAKPQAPGPGTRARGGG